MDEDLCAHRYRYYSSQILVPFIVEFAHVAGPESETCDGLLVFLEIFHPCAVADVDCEDAASAVPHEKFSFSVVQDDCR